MLDFLCRCYFSLDFDQNCIGAANLRRDTELLQTLDQNLDLRMIKCITLIYHFPFNKTTPCISPSPDILGLWFFLNITFHPKNCFKVSSGVTVAYFGVDLNEANPILRCLQKWSSAKHLATPIQRKHRKESESNTADFAVCTE